MGPTVSILLPYSPDQSDIASLDDIARSLGSSSKSAKEFFVENTFAIGGSTEATQGARPFVAAFENPDFEKGEAEAIQSAFAFTPVTVISVAASCNDRIDHRVLGELAAHLAQYFGGIVGFGGALSVTGETTGKLLAIAYDVEERNEIMHVGDVTFMRAWLRDPQFHMVK